MFFFVAHTKARRYGNEERSDSVLTAGILYRLNPTVSMTGALPISGKLRCAFDYHKLWHCQIIQYACIRGILLSIGTASSVKHRVIKPPKSCGGEGRQLCHVHFLQIGSIVSRSICAGSIETA